MTQPCSSTSARSNGTTSFSTARTSSIVPGSVSNRSLCCISTPIWALPLDAQRLPSYTAIPILAALWEHLPENPDHLGNARHLLKKFLWRAFLTSRYEQSSTTNALQDYRGLPGKGNGGLTNTVTVA